MSFYNSSRPSLLSNLPPAIKNIVIINAIMLLATWLIPNDAMYKSFALFSFGSPYFHPWQFVTHMFMHGGFWHFFFNMYTLIIFGSVLENTWGTKKFLIFYFAVGLGAALCHNLAMHCEIISFANAGNQARALATMNIPTVGASGAIYGVLLGFAMLFPNAELSLIFVPFLPVKAKWMVMVFAVLELSLGVFGTADGVAHFAHLGGMLFGWLIMTCWKKKGKLYN